jgi:Protein of unknown function (DUF1569)
MKTVFDASTCDELLRRVDSIQAGSVRQWGKMSATQMLEHTARVLEMPTGHRPTNQALIGRLIAWIFKKNFLGEKPFGRNAPTGPQFIVKDEPALVPTRERVKTLIRELHALGQKGCDGRVHAFFGPLTGAEWGVSQFKHIDHHLRQFSA